MRRAEMAGKQQRTMLDALLQERRRVVRATSGNSQNVEFQCGA